MTSSTVAAPADARPDRLTPAQLEEVRGQVRALLERSEAFGQLPQEARGRLAHDLVRTVAYFAASPGPALALGQGPAPAVAPPAVGLADGDPPPAPATKLADRLAGKQDVVGKDFQGAAVNAGVGAFKQMVESVNFSQFVSGLIEGVFTSIVNSSIRQMEAYGKLLEAVVKSVNEYAQDHVTPNQARDFLRNKYPDVLKVDVEDNQPRLGLNDGANEDRLPQIQRDMGLPSGIDLGEPESETALVHAAQMQMARMRQQQLATMVLLGINRIVVTDGLINAKVVFDMHASDTATRQTRATSYDKLTEKSGSSGGGWFSDSFDNTSNHETVVTSSLDDTSESKADVKAKLSGEVRVNFKSETFPLERMASSDQITTVQDRAQR